MDDVIFQSFIDNGVEYLLSYGDLLENEDILNEIYTHMEEEEKENRKKNIFNSGAINFTDITDNRYAIRKMIKEGYISKEDDKLFINKRMQSSLFLFLSYLREIKYYSSKEVITEPLSS
ncbi:MAG: hypothetical protein M0D57_15135 [Sphingobacteriales bacterium JAD_PAG50586_3]|nr:MAG: hypothetical protein M0D57_15135 [Sphingobacteriales bacterium JAD_PAG50586_3]